MRRRTFVLAGLALPFAGCDLLPDAPLPEAAQPRFVPWVTPARLAVVLSSGGLRGFSHVGVLKALDEIGVKPDLVVGASVGALLGCVLCTGVPVREVEALALSFDLRGLARLSMTQGYKLSGRELAAFVDSEVARRVGGTALEKLPVRYAAVAADTQSGEAVAFNAGNVGRAVQASCAIPGKFDPVPIRGRLYADGDLVSPLPVRLARSMGAARVIAVDCSARPENAPPGAERYRTGDLHKKALVAADTKHADLVLHPDIGYWVNPSREYRERTARVAYEYTMGRARQIVAVGGV